MDASADGRLVILSGPSGVGKSTVVRRLMQVCELPLVLSVSATTRPPRDGEVDGVDYFFLSDEEFRTRREAGNFLESCEVFGKGYWYGTISDQVEASLSQGKWVILEIDVEGAAKVVRRHPQAVTIFVGLPNLEQIEQRLRKRGTEDEQTIQRRLQVASSELEAAAAYQHFVVNDDVARAAEEICDILKQSQARLGSQSTR